MSDIDRDELRRLLAEATPGPWRDEMMQGQGVTLTAIIAGKPNPDDLRVIGSTLAHNDARALIAAVNALEPLLNQLDAAESALNDAILYENDYRDALARQTPHYLAAQARIEAVRELHRESHVKVLASACADEECDHEDDCPLVDYAVCTECYAIGDEAHPYAYEEGGVERVAWPCLTISALHGGE